MPIPLCLNFIWAWKPTFCLLHSFLARSFLAFALTAYLGRLRINGYKDSVTFTIPLEKEVEDDLGRNTNIKEDFDIIDLNNLTLNIKRKADMLSAEMIQKTLSCLNKESK